MLVTVSRRIIATFVPSYSYLVVSLGTNDHCQGDWLIGVLISDLDRRTSSTTTTITITITELVQWTVGFTFQYYLNLICTVQH